MVSTGLECEALWAGEGCVIRAGFPNWQGDNGAITGDSEAVSRQLLSGTLGTGIGRRADWAESNQGLQFSSKESSLGIWIFLRILIKFQAQG